MRRLPPPRNDSGSADYTTPAVLAAGTLAVGLFFVTTHLALGSGLFREQRAMACAGILLSCTLLGSGVLLTARWAFAKWGLYIWQIPALAVSVLAMGWTAPDIAAYVFPRVEERFARELGDSGRCLHRSPYRLEESQTTFSGRDHRRMTITPLQDGVPPLRLDNALHGGLAHLEPADPASRQILDTYGC
ncbi:MAG TPA: hypothetical protein VN520_30610 [Streptomyces sp.]|uniref:hypothetical protein n=1 Tax=Streptomyces sp. TaxID=1931 RepID=UPI002C9C5482|nr:hypothetical protein [Streptomyces sp.]HWU10664.1 hypothetical protein [Streptomyces sp.]